MENIIVRVVNMPYAVRGCTALDENGDYNVYLNARRGDQAETWEHEKRHIERDDFDNDESITEVETSDF